MDSCFGRSTLPKTGKVRWAFNVENWTPDEADWERALGMVEEGERQRILKFRRPTTQGYLVGRFNPDSKSALIGRLFLLLVAAEQLDLPLNEIQFGRTTENKPYLKNATHHKFPNFNFNLSHHGAWVILGSEPQDMIGVDVMKIDITSRDKRVVNFFHDMRDCFTTYEWSVISRGKGSLVPRTPEWSETDWGRLDQFYRHWTLKEAYIKAIGIGLGFQLQRAEFHQIPKDQPQAQENAQPTQSTATDDVRNGQQLIGWAKVWIDGDASATGEGAAWSFQLTYLDGQHIAATARGPFEHTTQNYKRAVSPPPPHFSLPPSEFSSSLASTSSTSAASSSSSAASLGWAWRVWTFEEIMHALDAYSNRTV
jgi:phosphopantetheinyl transferase